MVERTKKPPYEFGRSGGFFFSIPSRKEVFILSIHILTKETTNCQQLIINPTWQFEQEINGTDGYTAICQKKEKFYQRFYKPEEIPNILGTYINQNDVYISQNSFYKPDRTVSSIRQLRTLYTDIDCYKRDLSPDQAFNWLMDEYVHNNQVPLPNIVIFSGRGLQVVWRMVPVRDGKLARWQAVNDHFNRVLGPLGSDLACSDAARVLRLIGTVNSKNNMLVGAVGLYDGQYELEYLEEYLPVPKQRKSKGQAKQSKVVQKFNRYTLAWARREDIKTLIHLRRNSAEGTREKLLFLYRYYSCLFEKDPDLALQSTLEMNQMFAVPLPDHEVIAATRSAEKMYQKEIKDPDNERIGYKFSNKSLIDFIEITLDEQEHLKTIIAKNEKYKRNNKRRESERREAGKTKRVSKQDRLDQLKELMVQYPEVTKKELAGLMGISYRQLLRIEKG